MVEALKQRATSSPRHIADNQNLQPQKHGEAKFMHQRQISCVSKGLFVFIPVSDFVFWFVFWISASFV
jgi:hypothetical protein